ncbi:hypothetical protein ACWIWK_03120 [Helicobacter sp. 23-1048]
MIDKKRILSRLSLMQEYINEIEQMLEESTPYKPDKKSNNNTSNEPKIGEIARYRLAKLLAQRVWSPQEFASFFDERYCKDMFDIDFALLTQGSKFDEKGYSRYYKHTISINGKNCYLCSQWYERSRGKLLAFIEKYEN